MPRPQFVVLALRGRFFVLLSFACVSRSAVILRHLVSPLRLICVRAIKDSSGIGAAPSLPRRRCVSRVGGVCPASEVCVPRRRCVSRVGGVCPASEVCVGGVCRRCVSEACVGGVCRRSPSESRDRLMLMQIGPGQDQRPEEFNFT
jgi:hypothetical protein